MKGLFTGTGVALVTPFRKQSTIDFSRLGTLIDNIIESGVNYIVALGTTSEAATMTESERAAIQDFVIESVDDRVPIMLGIGGNNTQAVLDAISSTNFDGISGILSLSLREISCCSLSCLCSSSCCSSGGGHRSSSCGVAA